MIEIPTLGQSCELHCIKIDLMQWKINISLWIEKYIYTMSVTN